MKDACELCVSLVKEKGKDNLKLEMLVTCTALSLTTDGTLNKWHTACNSDDLFMLYALYFQLTVDVQYGGASGLALSLHGTAAARKRAHTCRYNSMQHRTMDLVLLTGLCSAPWEEVTLSSSDPLPVSLDWHDLLPDLVPQT